MAFKLEDLVGTIKMDLKQIDSADKKLERFLGLVGRVTSSLQRMAGAAVATALETANNMDEAQFAFEAMTGSQEKALKLMEDMQAFAVATPFEFEALTDGARRMNAMGIATENIIPLMNVFGDQVSSMGGNKLNLDRLVLAFTQIASKGRVATQELNQLAENGINGFEILADAMGVSTAKARELVEAGQVGAQQFLPELVRAMASQSGGAMEKMSQTLRGRWTALMEFLRIEGAKAITPLKDSLRAAIPVANEFAGVMFKLLPPVISAMAKLVDWTSALVQLFNVLPASTQKVILGLLAAATAAGLFAVAVAALAFTISVTVSALGALYALVSAPVMIVAVAIVGSLVLMFGQLILVIIEVGAFWVLFSDQINMGLAAMSNAVSATVGGLDKAVGDILKRLLSRVIRFWDRFLGVFEKANRNIGKALEPVLGENNIYLKAAEKLKSVTDALDPNDVGGTVNNIVGYAENLASEYIESAKQAGAQMFNDAKEAGNWFIQEARKKFDGMVPDDLKRVIEDWQAGFGASGDFEFDLDSLIKRLQDQLTNSTKTGSGSAKDLFKESMDIVKEKVNLAAQETQLHLDDAFAPMLEGLEELAQKFKDQSKLLAGKFADDVGSAAGFPSQIADYAQVMKGTAPVMGGLIGALVAVVGNTNTMSVVSKTVGDVFQEASNILDGAIGPIQGFVETIGELVKPLMKILFEASPLAVVLKFISAAFQFLGDALAPVVHVVKTFADMMGGFEGIMTPVVKALDIAFEGLFWVFKAIGLIVLNVAIAIGTVWNAILGVVIDVLEFVGKIPGLKKLVQGAIDSLESMLVDVDGMADARKTLNESTYQQAEAADESAAAMEESTENVKKLNDELLNIPNGIKIALLRFRTMDTVGSELGEIPKLAKGGIVTKPTLALIGEKGPEVVTPLSRPGPGGLGGSGVGTTIIIEHAEFNGVNDVKTLYREIEAEGNRVRFSATGSRHKSVNKYGVR